MTQCSKCKREDWGNEPAEATGLFVGTFWNENAQRVMPYRGHLCDMHADQAESGRFITGQLTPQRPAGGITGKGAGMVNEQN